MQDWSGDTAKGAKTVFGEMRATIHPFNQKLLIERPPGKEGHETEKENVAVYFAEVRGKLETSRR